MAIKEYKQAKDLPIRTAAWRVLELCDNVMVHLDKDHKHTWGREMVHTARYMLRLIAKANRIEDDKEKAQVLMELLDEYHDIADMVKFLAEGSDLKDGKPTYYLPQQYYVQGIPLLANLERQASGWLRKTQANITTPAH